MPKQVHSNDLALKTSNLGKRYLIASQAEKEGIFTTTRRLLTGRTSRKELWALRGVTLELRRGEILGIIGPNGAGKTTLVMLLSDILGPTQGSVEVYGKTSQFSQLSSGLQARLTVIENFWVVAALLGIPKRQFRKMLPEIIEFSGLQEYLYAKQGELSEGLASRVAFSVAVHSDLDIILVDEMLSVGDEVFKRKCAEVFKRFQEDGRTMVIVSHGMETIQEMCTRCLYLKDGKPRFLGETREATQLYLEDIGVRSKPTSGPPEQDDGSKNEGENLADLRRALDAEKNELREEWKKLNAEKAELAAGWKELEKARKRLK